MPTTETSLADLRAHLADHIHEVTVNNAVVYLTSRGRRVAALVPITDADQVVAHRSDTSRDR